ncbi:MOSC domain-containing protein [Nocardioides alcanivorans]|uniref:MOSC domain-containing protein n=1 Tax=Nocardioides alcanivorans TaxID=2897352 RepID=UPI001F255363|nr:MOSC domain-containing protein [Nocardioides alcanivorans]
MSTVSTPLMDVVSDWDGKRLSVMLPDGRVLAEDPEPTGPSGVVDYWGREAHVTPHDGVVSQALADHVARDVVLARAVRGDIVYGAPVTILGSASLHDLATRMGEQQLVDQSERFRSTFLVETGRPGEEDDWVGHEVRLGDAVVKVVGRVGRCGVINFNPTTAGVEGSVLKQLATYRPSNERGEPYFAVLAEVVRPGAVPAVGSVGWK